MKKIRAVIAAACAVVLTACGGSAGPGRPVAPVINDSVTEVAVTHITGGRPEKWTLTDSGEIALLSQWAAGLEYRHVEFDEGNTPGDSDGGEVYDFLLTPGAQEGGYPGFSYVINGPEDCWLLIEGYWFSVKNPSDPPLREPDGDPGGRVEDVHYAVPVLGLETLKSLVELRGEDLSWMDFAPYECKDIGSGLYIWCCPIAEFDGTLCLVIGGGSTDSPPMYIRLATVGEDGLITDNYIDPRYEDIDAFVSGIRR